MLFVLRILASTVSLEKSGIQACFLIAAPEMVEEVTLSISIFVVLTICCTFAKTLLGVKVKVTPLPIV